MPRKTKTTKVKRMESSCRKRYGVKNVSQLDSVKAKKKKTFLQRYGVENPSQIPEVRKKIVKTCVKKYGVEYSFMLYNKESPNIKSFFQTNVEAILKKKKIKILSEQALFSRYNRVLKRRFSPRVDIIIEDAKIVIECYGDYWHANPSKFSANEKIRKFKGFESASSIWEYDKIRENHIKSFGYKVIVIWQTDFLRDPNKQISKILLEYEKRKKEPRASN
jgi:G:T-mismatch repair DNA endonuclease (very short patch repair protein)